MLHSGSRGVGNAIGRYFIELARRDMERHEKSLPDWNLSYFEEGSPNFADYVESLGRHLVQSMAAEASHIRLHTDLEPLTLDVETAIPCGLILNELLTNALKYAFPAGLDGDITIGLRAGAGQVTLMVRDTGIGFRGDFDVPRTEHLGLQLVGMLTEQLGGTLTLTRAPGTTFTLSFPYPRGR